MGICHPILPLFPHPVILLRTISHWIASLLVACWSRKSNPSRIFVSVRAFLMRSSTMIALPCALFLVLGPHHPDDRGKRFEHIACLSCLELHHLVCFKGSPALARAIAHNTEIESSNLCLTFTALMPWVLACNTDHIVSMIHAPTSCVTFACPLLVFRTS